jgi:hypothetical protein
MLNSIKHILIDNPDNIADLLINSLLFTVYKVKGKPVSNQNCLPNIIDFFLCP